MQALGRAVGGVRLIHEERTVGQDAAYELWYSYDQLGNRLSKIDTVSGRWVEYDYDVELADPQVLDYPTWHNRLLQYRVYDGDPEDPETNLLRTVAYAYYKTGQASNITIKDAYVDAVTTPGDPNDYDVYHDLALYYHSHGPLWRALWGTYEVDANGHAIPGTYVTQGARELFYDSPRARYAAIDYDTAGSADPAEWSWLNPALWTDYVGDLPYRDLETERYAVDPNDPNQFAYTQAETMRYLGTVGQQPLDGQGDPTDTLFLHGDLIGSTMLTTDEGGTAVSALSYTAFGEAIGAASTLGTRYQYAGKWGYEADLLALEGPNPNLPPITLQHVGHRWYQPDIGRFVQRDPIGVFGDLNVYAYLQNNPPTGADPLGLLSADPELDEVWWEIREGVKWGTAEGMIVGGVIGGAPGAVVGGLGGGTARAVKPAARFVHSCLVDILDLLNDWIEGQRTNDKQRAKRPDVFPPAPPLPPPV